VEYALLIAFIAVVALVAVQLLGNSISSLFSSVGSNL
jgi:Flp pilus assembly pilin Flp